MNFFCLNIITVLLLTQKSNQRSYLVPEEDLPSIKGETYETRIPRTRSDQHFGKLYLKLAIFYDKHLLIRFGDNRNNLRRFLSSIVYSSQLVFNRDNIRKFAYFELIVVEYSEYPGILNSTSGTTYKPMDVGQNEILLRDFCYHQRSLRESKNLTKWSAALLFTGLNLWSAKSKIKDRELGLSFINSICGDIPCGIVETRDIYVTHIFTHEFGHILSLEHDGRQGCPQHIFIMTASYSRKSKNDWSECSANQLRNKLKELEMSDNTLYEECLAKKVIPLTEFDFSKQKLPGIEWPIDKQCQFGFGANYRAITTPPYYDICSSLHCRSSNDWYERDRGFPAMEGTYCGSKWVDGVERRHYCRSDVCTTKGTQKLKQRTDLTENSDKMLASNLNLL